MKKFAAVAALLLCCSGLAFADLVYLKDGGMKEGTVLKSTKDAVVLEMFSGGTRFTITIPKDEVEKTVEKKDSLAERRYLAYKKMKASAERANSAREYFMLAMWAKQAETFGDEMKQALEHVIALQPDHAQARRELGYVRHKGEWMLAADRDAKKGLVKYRDVWVTKEKAEELEKEEKGGAADPDTKALNLFLAQLADKHSTQTEERTYDVDAGEAIVYVPPSIYDWGSPYYSYHPAYPYLGSCYYHYPYNYYTRPYPLFIGGLPYYYHPPATTVPNYSYGPYLRLKGHKGSFHYDVRLW